MGFSLESFFDELEQIVTALKCVESSDVPMAIEVLETFVKESRKYAEECGQL